MFYINAENKNCQQFIQQINSKGELQGVKLDFKQLFSVVFGNKSIKEKQSPEKIRRNPKDLKEFWKIQNFISKENFED